MLPLLKLSPRLKDGYGERVFRDRPEKEVDIWIQAASAGEAYLAISLVNALPEGRVRQVLISTNTRQGMEILESGQADMTRSSDSLTVDLMFFPFDKPSIMKAAVRHISPRVMIILESELWPGLLAALHAHGCPILIVNARMRAESLQRYRLFVKIWKALGPHRVLAISRDDADRFARLFGRNIVSDIPNLKFDRIRLDDVPGEETSRLARLLPAGTGLLVFGSVRKQEEADIVKMIKKIHHRFPSLVMAVFPRHMHRLDAWRRRLTKAGTVWTLRSEQGDNPVNPGTIILWDEFGELNAAYGSATAVFVGGSLAPLGGQNFLEPLIYGIVPVIGPFWENFAWAGEALFSLGLVRKTADWRGAASELMRLIADPPPRRQTRAAAIEYFKKQQGGTVQAAHLITRYLSLSSRG